MEYQVEIVQSRGSAYHVGQEVARKYVEYTHLQGEVPTINIEEMEKVYETFAPHFIEELQGIAERLEIPYERAASLYSGFAVPKLSVMGCSALMTHDFYVRNYDFSPDYYDGIFSLIQQDETFASAGYNLSLLGRHDGVNEKGVVAGLHFVSFKDYQPQVSAWAAVRMVLDRCGSAKEAIDLLKEIPHAACYNFSIADSTGMKVVVEASPTKVMVREAVDRLPCVNHFQHQELTHYNRENIQLSTKRLDSFEEIKDQNMNANEVFDLFRKEESPFFFKYYDELFGTLHTIMYEYKSKTITTCLANGEKIVIPFDNWVKGENMTLSELTGIITR
ncbi:C45 family autoproteolytic acyltransferase/hydrolase [Bacillus carboniphilus]|uniref:C45 family autoproteolytic acyltransferase/hydrolase n=1 Tax=Bacillus carboniphilus TaxID=86663 RepID=A0ABY9JX30_9BACI|nr:C45 family peptidase [Bacillus carboniphilus]WLR43063.1 C45 family autoproteolytic acyltransferase/hydrolase [Bacillus carboniphilus]